MLVVIRRGVEGGLGVYDPTDHLFPGLEGVAVERLHLVVIHVPGDVDVPLVIGLFGLPVPARRVRRPGCAAAFFFDGNRTQTSSLIRQASDSAAPSFVRFSMVCLLPRVAIRSHLGSSGSARYSSNLLL